MAFIFHIPIKNFIYIRQKVNETTSDEIYNRLGLMGILLLSAVDKMRIKLVDMNSLIFLLQKEMENRRGYITSTISVS